MKESPLNQAKHPTKRKADLEILTRRCLEFISILQLLHIFIIADLPLSDRLRCRRCCVLLVLLWLLLLVSMLWLLWLLWLPC